VHRDLGWRSHLASLPWQGGRSEAAPRVESAGATVGKAGRESGESPQETRLSPAPPLRWRTAGWTALALVAFAANSWICRGALRSGAIEPASFTALRILSGAVALLVAARSAGAFRREATLSAGPSGGGWPAALALFAYAAAFSFAYLELEAGLGALVLFGAVQLTMLAGGLREGVRPGPTESLGIALALAGLILLGAPGRGAPRVASLALMAAAGVAWGIYSLIGRGAARPLAATTGNFLRASLPAAALGTIALALPATARPGGGALRPEGIALALLSGAVTSGLGYVFWYAALPGLSAARAGLVQLAVPVLAAVGGVALLGERWSARLVGSGLLVLTGLALAIGRPARTRPGSASVGD